MVLLITLCNYVGLIDCMIILSVLEIHMAVDRVMIFSFTHCRLGFLAILHAEQVVFCRVVPMLLANVKKIFCLHESNVLSAVFLLTVIFGMVGRRAFGVPDLLILED